MNSTNIQTDTLFLLDRNVVSVIKVAIAGNEQKGEKEQRMLDFLREIDAPQYAISPLPSLMEGEHGREDNLAEKAKQLEKETEAVARFFRSARTDSEYLKSAKDMFAQIFTGLREADWDARAAFRTQAAPLLIDPVAPAARRAVEDKLAELAISGGLEKTDGIVVLFVACLYGNLDARKVLKPTKPDATYNVLSDVHLIPRIALVKAVARDLPIQLKVRFLSLDRGLEQVLDNVRVVLAEVTGDGELQTQVKYLPPLFPELVEDEAIDLLSRLNTPAQSSKAADPVLPE
ncbi:MULTISPECIES: hypothetical protein [unclassified Caballeronia]|uniref:hypothetical protein n=1 Tax=unclassified Caballeronia TaxID=2646786 RepID=UPI001F3C00E1|nr:MULTISPECIES: hypothetical protein [unclassified Caballeronia]MCE4548042.1 hypothetical protein [Caballeronia sp. PC1]MCE4575880.1 hypothetical protein [Caballeronia sp. CLC5]